jgi:PAS domain S-box-containing protein
MTQKPTYEKLERRVKDLEKESLEFNKAEQVLKSERDKLKTLLDGLASANIGVDIVTTNYEVLQQNQTLIDRFGDIVGKKCYKEYMALEEPCSFCPMVKALENKRLERTELRAADGRDYELLAAPLTNPDGTVDKAIEVVQDITDRKQAEKELLFKENIIISSSSVIATCDLDGNMTYGNPSFLKAWGFDDAKEFLGKPFGEFWVVEDMLDEIMQALRSKGEWLGETKAMRKDGTLFDAQVSAAMVYDIEGNPAALTSTSIDITERKKAEEELRESEERYRSLIHKIQAAVVVHDADTRIIACNSKAQDLLGLTEDQMLGKTAIDPYWKFLNADGERMSLKEYPVNQVMATLQPLRDLTVGIYHSSKGKQLWVLINAVPGFDYKGNIQQVIVTFMDITERKRAEETLRESEERYRNLFKYNHSVMLLIDPESADIVDANPAAISYYGWNHKELTSKKIADINTLTEEQVFQEIEKAKLEQRRHFIFRHRLSNGDIRDVEVYSGPLQLRGKQLLCSIVHDITDRKQAEEEREKLINELQEALKEIKTLRGILPFCSYCKKIRDDKGYWEQVDVYIHKHSQADISHGICPECAKEHYPDLDIYDD